MNWLIGYILCLYAILALLFIAPSTFGVLPTFGFLSDTWRYPWRATLSIFGCKVRAVCSLSVLVLWRQYLSICKLGLVLLCLSGCVECVGGACRDLCWRQSWTAVAIDVDLLMLDSYETCQIYLYININHNHFHHLMKKYHQKHS